MRALAGDKIVDMDPVRRTRHPVDLSSRFTDHVTEEFSGLVLQFGQGRSKLTTKRGEPISSTFKPSCIGSHRRLGRGDVHTDHFRTPRFVLLGDGEW